MILRPVSPASATGPPTTKRPVGLMKVRMRPSFSSAGITASMKCQPMGIGDRQRHQLWRLVACETEHHAGVAGAPDIDSLSDVRRLLVDGGDHSARLGVESILCPRVADLPDRLPDDARDVDVAIGGDLAEHDHKAGGDGRLAG